MSEFTELENEYMISTVPCRCQCAFHKYGITEEEIIHRDKEEAKRVAEHNRHQKKRKAIFDDMDVFTQRGTGQQETIIIETSNSKGEKGGPVPVRYGYVADLEKELADGKHDLLEIEIDKAWTRYHNRQKLQ